MHCRSIRDDDTLEVLEQFCGENALHAFLPVIFQFLLSLGVLDYCCPGSIEQIPKWCREVLLQLRPMLHAKFITLSGYFLGRYPFSVFFGTPLPVGRAWVRPMTVETEAYSLFFDDISVAIFGTRIRATE